MSNVLRGCERLAAPVAMATLLGLGNIGCSSTPEHEAPDTTVATAPATEVRTIHDHAQATLKRLAGRILEEAQKGDKHEVIGDRTVDRKVTRYKTESIKIKTTVDATEPPSHSEYRVAVSNFPHVEPVQNTSSATLVTVVASNVPGRVGSKNDYQIEWSMSKDHRGRYSVAPPGIYTPEHSGGIGRPVILDTDLSYNPLNPSQPLPQPPYALMTPRNLAEQVQLADQRLDSMHDGLPWPAIS